MPETSDCQDNLSRACTKAKSTQELPKALNLSRLTLSDVVRDRDPSVPMSDIVVIQEGDTEVLADQQLTGWIDGSKQICSESRPGNW